LSFSLSTFTVEINGTSTIVFQAKWQVEADEICRGWSSLHWDEMAVEKIGGIAIPPTIKVRLAFPFETAAYEAVGQDVEFYGEVKIVRLADITARSDEAGKGRTDNQSDETAAERDP